MVFMEDLTMSVETLARNADILWTLIAAILVFFMQAGFAWWRRGSPGPKMLATSS